MKGDGHGAEKVFIYNFSAAADEFWCVMRGCEEQTKKKDGQQDEGSSNNARGTDHNQNKRGQGQTAKMLEEGQTAIAAQSFSSRLLVFIQKESYQTID